jgi:hypothetical protein
MDFQCTVIIRSVGERTENLCKSLILEQGVPEEQIVIVNEVPFSAAMRKAFEIGIQRNLKWTLCVDADVLLRSNSITELLILAENQEAHVCEIQGLIIDKFANRIRAAGNHLYRTSLLPKVLEQIPAEGIDLRPEFHTLNRMASFGYPWKEFKIVIGLHDFEQSYQDIFRKCYVHAHKNIHVLPVFIAHWRKHINEDFDYKIALIGLAAGLITFHDVRVNKNETPFHYMKTLTEKNFEEKGEPTGIQLADVDKVVLNYINDGTEFLDSKYSQKEKNKREESPRESFKFKIANIFQDTGLIGFIPYLLSYSLYKSCRYIMKKISKQGNIVK